jgi:hypothetical protein
MEKSKRDWKDIAKDGIETVIKYANSSAYDVIQEKKKEFGRKITAIAFFIFGSIFLLIGLAEFINQLMVDGSWHGYTIVGSALVLVGIFFTKD